MNPLDLVGPQFLTFWLAGGVAVAVVTWLVRVAVGRSPRRATADEAAAKLHPTQVAYLVGGIERAVEAAVAGLHHRGLLATDSWLIKQTDARGEILSPEGVFRGCAEPARLSRLEQHVLRSLPSTMRGLIDGAGSSAIVIERELEEAGLLVADRTRATWIVRLAGLAWLGLGVLKIGIGIAHARPVAFLVLLVALGAWLLCKRARAPRETALGRAVMRLMRERHRSLELTATTAPAQVTADEMTLAYGLFGHAVAG
ncbi:MAG: TIGR04222 domain-containing membrane protein, partial [Myxococcota bacterium]|nr:TIGR04222 domain-containing membrane protein [Myxococcota bacterium]